MANPEGDGVREIGEYRWHWRGELKGRAWEVWASVDVEGRRVSFGEEPVDPYAKNHEGGGGWFDLASFRRGKAAYWHRTFPQVYRRVREVVDRLFPED